MNTKYSGVGATNANTNTYSRLTIDDHRKSDSILSSHQNQTVMTPFQTIGDPVTEGRRDEFSPMGVSLH